MNRPAQQDALATGADAISIVSAAARRRQVLIVDDDPIVVQSLNKILGGDYDVRFALSGPDALTMIAAGVPDLLLLDVDMPDMSGIDVCRQLRTDTH